MAATVRTKPSTLNIPTWQFLQVLRYLESQGVLDEYYLSAEAKLDFPHGDIQCADQQQRKLILNCLGLCGVDSPLPHYFIAEANRANESAEIMQQFLAIFQHRVYQLYYLAWKKFQPLLVLEQQSLDFRHYLNAIAGGAFTSLDSEEYAGAGLFGKRVHSAVGLAALLCEWLTGVSVRIKQFKGYWASVNNALAIGSQYYLGKNSLLGTHVFDHSNHIAIIVGPMPLKNVLALLPQTLQGQRFLHLITRYLAIGMHYQIHFLIEADFDLPLILGQFSLYLGWYCWLGRRIEALKLIICR